MHLPSSPIWSDFGCPLPEGVLFSWAVAEDWDTVAAAEEEAVIENAVLKRQREFRAGRNTARRCLGSLVQRGLIASDKAKKLPGYVGVGNARQPIWPDGIIGSISHTQFECFDSHSTQEYCGVVVGCQSKVRAIGIDIEPVEHLCADALDLIVTPSEWQRAKQHCYPTFWPKFLFTVKESIYKCLHPMSHAYLDFLEADLHLRAVSQMPGLYQVEFIRVESEDWPASMREEYPLEGYVYGDSLLVRAAVWVK